MAPFCLGYVGIILNPREVLNSSRKNHSVASHMETSFLCHHRILTPLFTFLTIASFLGVALFSVFEEHMSPGGYLLPLYSLVVASFILGYAVEILKLPNLLGMLIGGIVARNVTNIEVFCCLNLDLSSKLRNLALIVILTKAGIGLDPSALRELSFIIMRVAIIPCIFEACTIGVAGYYLLGLPWSLSFMLGFVLAAVSPAVVIPSMITLQQKGLGVTKGIPTLVVAAASVDDILAISMFGVLLGISFSTGENIILKLLKGPLEMLVGVSYGLFCGLLLWFLPHKNNSHRAVIKLLLLVSLNITLFFGGIMYDLAGAGALGCLTLAFTASCGWRKQEGILSDISKMLNHSWYLMEALLFGLIGTEVNLKVMDISIIGWGFLTILIGLIVRLIVAFLTLSGGGFTVAEKLFISIAWMPKATVQAALGTVALDLARDQGLSEGHLTDGLTILTVCVLVIITTAPLGALLIALTGPLLLTKTVETPEPDGLELNEFTAEHLP